MDALDRVLRMQGALPKSWDGRKAQAQRCNEEGRGSSRETGRKVVGWTGFYQEVELLEEPV